MNKLTGEEIKELLIIRNNLDKLSKSMYEEDRKIVAMMGYNLHILINDYSSVVRREVARQGYGLDILVNDISKIVVKSAKDKLAEMFNNGELIYSDISKKLMDKE